MPSVSGLLLWQCEIAPSSTSKIYEREKRNKGQVLADRSACVTKLSFFSISLAMTRWKIMEPGIDEMQTGMQAKTRDNG